MPRPEALLTTALRNLGRYRSVSAEIRHEVDLFGKHLVGSGHYWEQLQGRDRLTRLELKIQLGDQTSSLVQVCDGRFLWTKRKLLGNAKLTRIDAARATRALQQIEEAPGQDSGGMLPGLGGLHKVLRGLDASFDFTTAEPGRWGKEKRPVWRLRGQWKPDRLLEFLPDQAEALERGEPPNLAKLPEHLPDHVVLLLEQEDLFPYRIEYRRAAQKSLLRPDASESRALVTMQLFDVLVDVSIDPSRFHYNPGELKATDETEKFLKSLGVEE